MYACACGSEIAAGGLTLTVGHAGVFVHGLLYLDRDKVVCQTQEKTNKLDSGSIYILLCNTAEAPPHSLVLLLLLVAKNPPLYYTDIDLLCSEILDNKRNDSPTAVAGLQH